MVALTSLYPKVVNGGFMIIDGSTAFPHADKQRMLFRTTQHMTEKTPPTGKEAIHWGKDR